MGLTNIDEEQYRALPLVNQSAIKWGMKSMAHMKAYLDGEIKYTSDALSLGSLVHAVVLEEEYIKEMYAIMPKIDRRTKAGKAEYEEFLAINSDRVVCKQEDWDTAMLMRDSVWSHPAASTLLKREGKVEQSLTWHDPDSGLDCKGRIDLLLPGRGRQKPRRWSEVRKQHRQVWIPHSGRVLQGWDGSWREEELRICHHRCRENCPLCGWGVFVGW